MRVTGSCHCGSIRYQADVDRERVSICHCTDCQALTGTAYRVSVPVAVEQFKLLSGTPKIYVKTAESGNKRAQAFCADCGTPIYACALLDAKVLNLRVGSLRERAQLVPTRQIWFRSALPWALNIKDIAPVERE
jgi:hypothetical protein